MRKRWSPCGRNEDFHAVGVGDENRAGIANGVLKKGEGCFNNGARNLLVIGVNQAALTVTHREKSKLE